MNQRITTPTYSFALRVANLVAFLLIVLPVVDMLFTPGLAPFSPSQLRWRVAFIGLLSGAMLQPILGFFIAFTAAHALERRTLYRFLSLLSAAFGFFLFMGALLFLFDAIQLRGQISAETKRVYDIATVKSLVTQLLMASTFIAMTVTSVRLGRSVVRREADQRRALGTAAPIAAPQ